MLTRRIIPCLDVCGGRVVKGVRFANLRDAGDPVERALLYQAHGADELVLLDVSATKESRAAQVETIAAVRAQLSIPLTVGGGVRTIDDARALLEAGADKISLNTAAAERPNLIREIAERFGRQCTVVAIDAAHTEVDVHGESTAWELMTHAGTRRTGLDVIHWARETASLGAGEILLTSWDRDGTRSGYDTALLRAISSAVDIPIIASGGAATAQHMIDALQAGADAVLAAGIFHEGSITVETLKDILAQAGIEVRR